MRRFHFPSPSRKGGASNIIPHKQNKSEPVQNAWLTNLFIFWSPYSYSLVYPRLTWGFGSKWLLTYIVSKNQRDVNSIKSRKAKKRKEKKEKKKKQKEKKEKKRKKYIIYYILFIYKYILLYTLIFLIIINLIYIHVCVYILNNK